MLNVGAGVDVLRGCCVEVVESAAGMVTALGGGGASMQRYFYYFIIILLYYYFIENMLHWVIQIDYCFLENSDSICIGYPRNYIYRSRQTPLQRPAQL